MHIGIDVGGTNTDGALLDGRAVVAEAKTSTTPDVTSGIVAALESVLGTGNVSASAVEAVMIGTTHFTNAVLEARRLSPVATIRLGLPATEAIPPLTDWPVALRDAVGSVTHLIHGGHEFDGSELSPLDRDAVRRAAQTIGAKGIRSVAVSSVFSPLNGELERETAELLRDELGDVSVSLSHELGRVGLLERENATIINASLRELGATIVAAFGAALSEAGIDAPVYLSQNDGTLMSVDYAERYPVSTFASGPTNSMRGAALLSGLGDCAVVDVGGTSTDVGMLTGGFPRESITLADIGGVRTNFRMPDVLPIALGGGSVVRRNGALSIGPDSVGYELRDRALVFGGETLTASDIAVAAGRASFGDPAEVRGLDRDLVATALELIDARIATTLDRIKISAEPIPVVVVGGGSVLLADTLPGASELLRPEHFGCANAIGAAIAQVGGEVDSIYSLTGRSRDAVLDEAKQEAIDRAVAAGARSGSVEIVDVEEIGLAYLPGNAVRIKVKAIGDLEIGGVEHAAGH